MQRYKVGDAFQGRYELKEQLGRGGMGVVWRARDRTDGRDVALKFMSSALEADALARRRFEREGKAAMSLPSSYIVKTFDYGVEAGCPFLVMEVLEGEDLGTRLKRVGRLDLAQAKRIVSEACRGLRRAHEIGLIHRDLKPANLFLAREANGTEVTKILDFGMVKATATTFEQSVATESGAIVGSVQYASPEQAQGQRDLDARSDLWSIAALAFRLVTGRLAFPGEALGAVVLAICSRPPPRATDVDASLDPRLDAFFERAFQRDREARFQSALDLADAFVAATSDDASTRFVASAYPPPDLGGFLGEGGSTQVSSLDGATRVVDLSAEVTRTLDPDEADRTLEEASPFGATAEATEATARTEGAADLAESPPDALVTAVIEAPSETPSPSDPVTEADDLARVFPTQPPPDDGWRRWVLIAAAGIAAMLVAGWIVSHAAAPSAPPTPRSIGR